MFILGSLFDGSGGFPLAGVINDIYPVWASEIEPYPLKVTTARFPDMKQLGDVTKINGAEIEPVDIITFGSPCQDLSIAGKQAGIHDGERSNLFFQAIRIIKEMRDKTNGQYPRFALWENVPGAFSSNKGEDFRAVLEAFANVCGDNISIPRPPKNKWSKRGGVVGYGWSLAWRVYDAQYWGVPQRRKRIYLVADFASERAPEILFERESVSGDFEESRKEREGTTADAERSIGRSRAYGVDCYNQTLTGELSIPIRAAASDADHVGCVCYALQGNGIDRADTAGCNGCGWRTDEMYTLNTIDRHVVCYEGQNVCSDSKVMFTLQAGRPDQQHIPSVVYDARGNGDGKVSPTLTGDHQNRITDYTTVCVGNGQLNQTNLGDKTGALNCMHDQQAVIYPGVGITSPQNRNNPQPGDPAPSLTSDSRNYLVQNAKPPRKYIVRRLTPLECCRLQGFPDWWEDGVNGSDSARYKMWGNGIALPCAVDVLGRIAKELGSLDENNQM